eukprot:758388-Hanusia_phi.AAC.7
MNSDFLAHRSVGECEEGEREDERLGGEKRRGSRGGAMKVLDLSTLTLSVPLLVMPSPCRETGRRTFRT